ncbi:phospholipase [Actinoplanes sp. NPDC023801]|uniref:phospholipase n=1 Tax=Actinoplanes sp. NPDC023801 TaxID=3154595 RepID=UPI0033EADD11
MRRIAAAALLGIVLLPPAPARASSTDRQAILANWTQPTAESTAAWNAARLDQARWAEYRFDWSSDLCSRAPDTPLGFDFGNACRHHDFGYRNYRTDFARHKDRIDEVFRADLRRVCDARPLMAQPFCNSIAFTYYEAVRLLVNS